MLGIKFYLSVEFFFDGCNNGFFGDVEMFIKCFVRGIGFEVGYVDK